jgi:Uma2 family endonuclease
MTDTLKRPGLVFYPESDGMPMSESDPTRDYLLYCVAVLEAFFRGRPHVYVSGNLFVYYKEGDTSKSISPDVFVIFGVSKHKRRSYKTWQEGGKLPSFILEITSFSTQKQDEVEKPKLYASLGVQEYFQYDPTADYLNPQLKGKQLVNGEYQPLALAEKADGIEFIHSQVLGLDLCLRNPARSRVGLPPINPIAKELRFHDPQTEAWLLSYEESEEERLEARKQRDQAQQERDQVQQERDQVQQERDQVQQERDQKEQALQQAIAQLEAMGMSRSAIGQMLGIELADQ